MSISLLTSESGSGGASSVECGAVACEVQADFTVPRGLTSPADAIPLRDVKENRETISVALRQTESWSNTKEREFARLAALRALGHASKEDEVEFASLLALRRRTKNPLSADEIVFQHRRREMEQKLLTDLARYVDFLESAGRP